MLTNTNSSRNTDMFANSSQNAGEKKKVTCAGVISSIFGSLLCIAIIGACLYVFSQGALCVPWGMCVAYALVIYGAIAVALCLIICLFYCCAACVLLLVK